MLLSLHRDDPESESSWARFRERAVLARLKALDSRVRRKGLASLDPSRGELVPIGMEIENGRVVKNGYGVFNLSWQVERHPEWAEQIAAELEEIKGAIRAAHGAPLQFLIWAGMGGSAEDKSMYQAVGLLKRGPRCYVLDSTDPVKLRFILEDMTRRSRLPLSAALCRTLVVGMAMGMSSYEPVVNLEALAALYDRHQIDSRANFLYMTLPGSMLDQFACARGYRRAELQLDGANTTAGRHSGPLTRGSLYPLGLARVDLRAWLGATVLPEGHIYTAWRLASFLHVQGKSGRDKVTLLLPKPWAGADLWTKQDFEESLGKSEDLGIKIVIGERVRLTNYRPPKDPQQDRVFLGVQLKGAETAKLALVRRAGYPMATLTLPRGTPLSAYMQFIHYTVFGLAWLRKMNFVTQPSVELYKAITNRLHADAVKSGGIDRTREWQRAEETPRRAVWRGSVVLRWDRLTEPVDESPATAPELYAGLVNRLRAAQRIEYAEMTFFGDLRYSASGRAVRLVLQRAAEALFRAGLQMPADVYEGPAMNHSYHEMIIGHGKCFSTVLLAPGLERADYHHAQFLATQMALAERGRAVVSLTLPDLEQPALAALEEFFRQAAKHVKTRR